LSDNHWRESWICFTSFWKAIGALTSRIYQSLGKKDDWNLSGFSFDEVLRELPF
jgi:hypothetical protein